MEIIRPTLLLDKQKCLANINSIVEKANRSKVLLRPHFKTHQSQEIGRWYRKGGITACTVSSLRMAEYFAEDGWQDITVAFPLNYLESELINKLSSTIKLNLLATSVGVLPQLDKKLTNTVYVYIDIDTGYHRTGFQPDDFDSIEKVMTEIESSDHFKLEGFLSHAGHTYKCRSNEQIKTIHEKETFLMTTLVDKYRSKYPELKASIGDTPSGSVMNRFEKVDEVRPGNLVFYDLVQHQIGSCRLDQIAIAMACPVVATYRDRGEIVIYGGSVHFSKDLFIDESGSVSFGKVVFLKNKTWNVELDTGMFLKSVSQEHGIISAPGDKSNQFNPGDVVGILPVHACLTADAMGRYVTTEGEVIERLISPV